MNDLPPGHVALECTIGGVTYRGSYWVDESTKMVHVLTEFGYNSAPGQADASQREQANRSLAEWLFKSMIQTWLAC